MKIVYCGKEAVEEVGLIIDPKRLTWADSYHRPRGAVWFFATHLPREAVELIRFGDEGQSWRVTSVDLV